jgi:hypothetical protein
VIAALCYHWLLRVRRLDPLRNYQPCCCAGQNFRQVYFESETCQG